ncbi:MAG: hypothetical protein N2376_01235 [Clostridia bacterium]|nr:hypothetical protein [Clostridia bacterium]
MDLSLILSIAACLLAIVYTVYLVVTRQWDKLKKLAYALMLSAERFYADEDGQKKFNDVFREVYYSIPKWLRRFISAEELKKKLQEWYDQAKNSLSPF